VDATDRFGQKAFLLTFAFGREVDGDLLDEARLRLPVKIVLAQEAVKGESGRARVCRPENGGDGLAGKVLGLVQLQ